jgi:hypothetical protein
MAFMNTIEQAGLMIVHTARTLQARWGARASQVLRWSVPVVLLTFLGYRLSQIGWLQIWHSRPASPLFYLVLPFVFFAQPFADLIIYRNLWNVGKEVGLPVMLRKRYLDNVMLDYSGEAYFYFWAVRKLDLQKNVLLHAIKDSNVLSAGAGFAMLWLMLVTLLAVGAVHLPALLSHQFWTTLSLASVPLLLCLVLVAGGRRVTTLTSSQIASTFAIHMVRSAAGLALQFALWWFSASLPSAVTCLQFVALQLVITRLPVLPNKDLIFVGTGIAMASMLNLSTPSIAAVLVIGTAADQLLGFALVGLPWLFEQFVFKRKDVRPAT